MRAMRIFVLAAVGFALVVGCQPKAPAIADVLSGRVTAAGAAAKDVTLVAVGPDGTEASALTTAAGDYRIVNPPKGQIQFRLSALAPPPPPGTKAGPPPPGATTVPAKYSSPNNGLKVQYTGGEQKFDIDLTP